jgi:DNA repair exonuclease SbcCD ATPase subunit
MEEGDHEEISALIRELDEAKDKVKTQYFGAKDKLDAMVLAAQSEVDRFDEELNARHDPIIQSKQALIDNDNGQITKLNSAISSLIPVEKPRIAVDEIGKLQTQLDADKKLKVEKEELLVNNPYCQVIADLIAAHNKLELEAAQTDVKIKGVEAEIPYYEFWVSNMGKEGIKSFVIDQIIPTLNEQIEYWMQLIYQGTITVKFDKYFNVSMVNNSSRNEMIFGQGSGGERRRIDIAIMLAFRQVMKMSSGKDPNILFFDEVADNLDEEGVYRLYEAMQDIAKTNHLYVITPQSDASSPSTVCRHDQRN